MSRISPVSPKSAEGKTKELLDKVQTKVGRVPNILKTMAHSPAVLKSYLDFSGNLSEGVINAKVREKIALTCAQENKCDYCLAAHTAIGKMAGLTDAEVAAARNATCSDKKTDAALKFAQAIVKTKGFVSDDDMKRVRDAGHSDTEIVEIVAGVCFNIFTNYFNHVADTVIDFPKVT
jgi:uncharacterized peroxidase-related enzyme